MSDKRSDWNPARDATVVMGPGSPDGGAPQASQGEGTGEPAMQLERGALFAGRYVVDSLLGRGGMGVVYRARDRLVDEEVALKLLDMGNQPLTDEAVDMFRREVRVARRITHANVVRIHDLDEHRGSLFITMEFVEGSDLRREMDHKQGPMDPVRTARVALEVALGLGAAHAMGVVHRDLKPENVLVDRTGRSLLSDFGIARVFDKTGNQARETTHVIGTPTYMAPEQVMSQEIGPTADLYALGVMMFEMLAGRAPFVAEGAIATAIARLSQPAPDVRAFAPVPEQLASLVAQCLERAPDKRPQAAAMVSAELEGYLAEFGETRTPAVTRRPASVRIIIPPAEAPTSRGFSRALSFGSSRRSLACLPFTYRGPSEHDYLGEAVSGELIDVLSRTKGLRVLSSGAVAKSSERDPRKLTEELGVDYVVDGTIQVAGPKLRISVRLMDATGEQLFSERFDLGLEDLFDMQDEAGRRIAEALRLEVTARATDVELSEETMREFLQARRILRSQRFLEAPVAVALLEHVLEAAPEFTPAIASLAIATVHVWFYPQGDRSRDWEKAAEIAVQNALTHAPDLAETHVAAARISSQRGKLREAVIELRRAVEIAPTSPDAQNLLGQLECETGRSEEGLARLALSNQLEPTGVFASEAARVAALRGDHPAFDKLLVTVRKQQPLLVSLHLELRHAGWWGDAARLDRVITEAEALGQPFSIIFQVVARCFKGEADPQQAAQVMAPMIKHVNPRFGALLRQILVEVHARAGDHDTALTWLKEAQETVLYDTPWLDTCPLLEGLRTRADFAAISREVRARCAAVWTT